MEILDKLGRLQDLGVGGKILEMYGATIDDLDLMAEILKFNKKFRPEE